MPFRLIFDLKDNPDAPLVSEFQCSVCQFPCTPSQSAQRVTIWSIGPARYFILSAPRLMELPLRALWPSGRASLVSDACSTTFSSFHLSICSCAKT